MRFGGRETRLSRNHGTRGFVAVRKRSPYGCGFSTRGRWSASGAEKKSVDKIGDPKSLFWKAGSSSICCLLSFARSGDEGKNMRRICVS